MRTGDSLNLNLLPSQAKFQAERMKLQGTLRRYMSLALVFWVAVVLLVVVLFFGSGFILNLQNKKYEQAFSNYKGLSQEIVINQLLKYRVKVLGQALKDRFEYSSAFEKINSIFAEKTKVSKFGLDKNKEFSIEVKAADKETVDFIEEKVALANSGEIEGVSEIKYDGATYSINGEWLINMEVILK